MAMSMTGYGRGESLHGIFNFTVEAKSVNNRYMEVFVRLPRSINYLEDYVKQTLKNYVSRGKIEIFIKLNLIGTSEQNVVLDKVLAKRYFDLLMELDEELGIESGKPRSIDIVKLPDVMKFDDIQLDEEELKTALSTALDQCFSSLKEMRQIEGEKLRKDIISRCEILQSDIEKIESISECIEEEYRKKLTSKLTDLLTKLNFEVDEGRIIQEAAIVADKANVTEEIVRFKSHIIQLRNTCLLTDEPIGRKLDFLVQEMNREVNTIGSKSINLDITDSVIEIKGELEKIREQIQNIE